MPISTPAEKVPVYGGDIDHFEHVLAHLFVPALAEAGYDVVKPSVVNSEIIQAEIIRNLETADLVLCDISLWNANVFFELGIRVALDRPVAMVRDSETQGMPFDTAMISCHTYSAQLAPWSLADEIARLSNFVLSAGGQDRNALWRHFGITQRSVPSDAGSSSIDEKVDLILQYVSAGNRNGRTAEWPRVPTTDNDRVEDPVALAIIKKAAAIANEVSAELTVQYAGDAEIDFDLGIFTLDGQRQQRIIDLAKGTPYTVRVVGR
jgi:hypothetical protein